MRDRRFARILTPGATLALIAGVAIAVSAAPAAASCRSTGSLVDAVGGADLAVIGTIQVIEPDGYDTSHDLALRWGSPLDRVTVEVDQIVAGGGTLSGREGEIVLEFATLGSNYSTNLELEVGQRRALLLYRRWGALFADPCGSASPEEMLAVDVDLPEPQASGPVELVTAGWRQGPSDVQLRDRRGNVVAWSRVGASEDGTWLCPEGRAVVVGSRDALDGSLDQLVATDLITHQRHTTDVHSSRGLQGSIEECATPDGTSLVAIDQDAGLVQIVARSARGTAQIAALASFPTPIHAWSRVVGGSIVVARTQAVHAIDVDSGEVRDLAPLSPTARPLFADVDHDGRAAVVIADGADHEVLLIGADGNLARANLDVPGEVVTVQVVPGGALIGQHAAGFSDESGRIVHVDATGAPIATLVLREVPELGFGTSDRLWVGIDADGSLELVEPGDDGPEHIVPFAIYSTAAFVPPLEVPDGVRSLHTSDQLRALVPSSPIAPPAAPPAGTRATDEDSGPGVTTALAAGGAIALLALGGVLLSRRRRSARPPERP